MFSGQKQNLSCFSEIQLSLYYKKRTKKKHLTITRIQDLVYCIPRHRFKVKLGNERNPETLCFLDWSWNDIMCDDNNPTQKEYICSRVSEGNGMDKALGRESRNISKTGAWQNTKFTHLIDDKFGASLLSILKENDIYSITDLGCGTGAYVKMIEANNIRTQGKRQELDKQMPFTFDTFTLP